MLNRDDILFSFSGFPWALFGLADNSATNVTHQRFGPLYLDQIERNVHTEIGHLICHHAWQPNTQVTVGTPIRLKVLGPLLSACPAREF